jgi:hypothetical protein
MRQVRGKANEMEPYSQNLDHIPCHIHDHLSLQLTLAC